MASPFTPTTISHSLRQAFRLSRSSPASRLACQPQLRSLAPSISQSRTLRSSPILRPGGNRAFSTTPALPAKTIQQLKARSSTGPFSWKAALLFVLTGAGMIVYFQYEKARLERERIVQMSKGVGKPKVGGPFILKDLDGNVFTEEQLKGKYNFIYFGFTHCPDICPDELDKMAAIIDIIKEKSKGNSPLRSIFVTCDPARDTPEVLRAYLKEFHGDILGLTGTYEQVKNMCKQYRVYFSTPENIKPGEDYLVDHSIYFYLMDPEGDFVECIGRQDTPESAANIILDHIKDWKRQGRELDTSKP
ncbi:senC [Coccidioides immitis RMSCC 3703]|uniref:SenC n=2 Tax=Coccidioides immitis TaxID=5501 RepID=A0A0J8QV29_COCIT|nr:senC [Coccidioides immitis RMSCC 2394]KMU76724.1 senC [Coccidioides immitis RMSCC 3703]